MTAEWVGGLKEGRSPNENQTSVERCAESFPCWCCCMGAPGRPAGVVLTVTQLPGQFVLVKDQVYVCVCVRGAYVFHQAWQGPFKTTLMSQCQLNGFGNP